MRMRLEDAGAVAKVRADSDRLAQVITNLLSNAIKFSPPDHEVVVAIENGPEFVRISVRNYGPGIPADFKPHMFERFAQADSTTTRQKGGSGLGLSIVRQIVDRLGGEVGFTEASGETIFHVDLPCWEQLAGIAIHRDAPPDALRILLCEDDPDMAAVLREHLKQAGFATDFAYSATDAIQCAMAAQYCAILVDLLLPDGNGIDLIMRLRELPQYGETPIIVVSVDPPQTHRPRAPVKCLSLASQAIDFDNSSERYRGCSRRPAHDGSVCNHPKSLTTR